MTPRTLYTSADRGLKYWHITRPYLEHYADKVGAELVVLPKTTRANLTWVLFDAMRDSLTREGVFGWMDADIVMRRDAPDMFDLPDKFFVAAPDPPWRVHPRWRRAHSKHGVQNVRPYPITGMAKWSHRHVERLLDYVDSKTFWRNWGDQEVLALACFDLELHFAYFPQWWHAMTGHITKNTAFFHAAGGIKVSKILAVIRNLEAANLGLT